MTPEDLLYVKVNEDMVTKPTTSKATYSCWYCLATTPEPGAILILDRDHQELLEHEDYEVVGTIVIFHTLPLFPVEVCYGVPDLWTNPNSWANPNGSSWAGPNVPNVYPPGTIIPSPNSPYITPIPYGTTTIYGTTTGGTDPYTQYCSGDPTFLGPTSNSNSVVLNVKSFSSGNAVYYLDNIGVA